MQATNEQDSKITIKSEKENISRTNQSPVFKKPFAQKTSAKISKHILRGDTKEASPVLKVHNIVKKFGDFTAVDNVSFEIARGERIAIIGANGAGKTTITEIIAGLSKPTSGILEYGFQFDNSPQEGIGMQFQKSDYPSGLTVKDMVLFADNLRKLKTPKNRIDELLEIFQMSDFYKRKAKNLSGGQKQKLNILMSVLHKPRLIILDELSTGLDISAREEIISFTNELLKKEKMSAIVISHHFEEIEKLCTRVIAMDRGKIVTNDSIKNIISKWGSLEKFALNLIQNANVLIKEKNTAELLLQKESNAENKLTIASDKSENYFSENDVVKPRKGQKFKK